MPKVYNDGYTQATSVESTDVAYLVRSPYGSGDDRWATLADIGIDYADCPEPGRPGGYGPSISGCGQSPAPLDPTRYAGLALLLLPWLLRRRGDAA